MSYTPPARYDHQRAFLNTLSYPTPFLIMDLSRIEKSYTELQSALHGADLFYAVKANSTPGVIKHLAKLGAGFDVASLGEIRHVLKLGGKPDHIAYSNPVKPWKHIKQGYRLGIRRFAFDSVGELEKLARLAPGASVYLRLKVSNKGSILPLSKKFGAELNEAVPLMQMAKALGLQPIGLTFHVGGQTNDPRRWELAIRTAGTVVKALLKADIRISLLNLGGGFPTYYTDDEPDLETIGRTIHISMRKYIPYHVALSAEPGRAMVAEAGIMAATIIGHTVRERKDWLYLDVGAFNGMMETLESNNTLQYPITTSLPIDPQAKTKHFVLTGPTCDSQDTMFYDVQLPRELAIGDRVYIHSTGAYTLAYASPFNGFAIPKVYCVDAMEQAKRVVRVGVKRER